MEPRIIAALALSIIVAASLLFAYLRVTRERREIRASWKRHDKLKQLARAAAAKGA